MPRPKTAGIFVLAAALSALAAGYFRNELVLMFFGSAFLAILAWCFLAVLIPGITNRRKAAQIRVEILTKLIKAGENGALRVPQKMNFFTLPGTVIRYRMNLATRDNRIASCVFNPKKNIENCITFAVPGRGAYYGITDELLFMDAPGFFEKKIFVRQEQSPRLLAAPCMAEQEIPFRIHSGGSEKRREVNFLKTDNLVENRPYVPGDDPRRINWKLYGHGSRQELYVREGENSPPPHSRLLILLDTQMDPVLYSAEECRTEVDMLCENALRAAEELGKNGIEIQIGHTGGKIFQAAAANTSSALAWPAALPLLSEDNLPNTTEETGILILAAPRMSTGNTALDRYLHNPVPGQKPELLFLYTEKSKNAEERAEAAKTCAAFYRSRTLHAASYAVNNSDIYSIVKEK